MDKKEVGKRIRVARALKGLTQMELSKKSGISVSRLSQIESGNDLHEVREKTLIEISKSLSQDVDYLLDENVKTII